MNAGQGLPPCPPAIKTWWRRLGSRDGLKVLKEETLVSYFLPAILEGDTFQGLCLCRAAFVEVDGGVMPQRGPELPTTLP